MLLDPTKSVRVKPLATYSNRIGRGTVTGIHTDFKHYETAALTYEEDGQLIASTNNNQAGRANLVKEDPAITALRYAGIGVPAKAENGSSLTNGELAKRAFEEHGLTFDLMAQETYRLLEECEPTTKLQALKFVNDVLTLDSEAKLKQLLEASKAPTINIQINNAFSEGSARTPLDILIPNPD